VGKEHGQVHAGVEPSYIVRQVDHIFEIERLWVAVDIREILIDVFAGDD